MLGESSTPAANDDDDEEEDGDSDEETEQVNNKEEEQPAEMQATSDEYNFSNYDNEQSEPVLKLTDVVEVDDKEEIADEDSDAEDDIIKPTDNLVLVGKVESDCSSLEVYIFNEEENSLYVHHDFLLPFHLLCVEWFSYDAGSENPGNLCAIGGMEPLIHIYDLDIHQPLEPAIVLGVKGSKKKKIQRIGHKKAVLDLSWNSNFQHIMASGSVDQTVILWDLEHAVPSTTLKDFAEKVQTIEFNKFEAEYLLTGCSDNTVKLFDCRQSNDENAQYKKWLVEGEVEKVKWNPNEKYHFAVGTNAGKIYYFDSRTTEPLWSVDAHEQEITDMAFNTTTKNAFTTASVDNYLKVWNMNESACKLVHSQHCKVAKVYCLDACPENNWIVGIGGDKRKRNFVVTNLLDSEEVKKGFEIDGRVADAVMDAE